MALSQLSGVVGILRETIKVLAKCRHAMTIIAIISIIFQSLLLFATSLFPKPILSDLVGKGTFMAPSSPQGSEFPDLLVQPKHDVWLLQAIQFASYLVSIFVMAAITLVISTTYKGKSISFEDLIYKSVTSCFKQFITSLYIFLYSFGYMLPVMAILVLAMLSINTIVVLKAVLVSVGVVASLLFIYLYIGWIMGLVVSVVEENCYGIEALRKASRLVEGKRLDGYLLNVIAIFGSFFIYQITKMFTSAQSDSAKIVFGFLASVLSGVMRVFMQSAHTVFYFKCKEEKNGEEFELKERLEYIKVPSSYTPHVSGDIP